MQEIKVKRVNEVKSKLLEYKVVFNVLGDNIWEAKDTARDIINTLIRSLNIEKVYKSAYKWKYENLMVSSNSLESSDSTFIWLAICILKRVLKDG